MGFEDICQPHAGAAPDFALNVLGGDWKVLVFLGLLITISCLAVLYMIANFMRNSKLLAWVNSELFQVVATAILATLIIGWVSGICVLNAGYLDDRYAGKTVYDVADDYLQWGTQVGKDVFVYAMVANYVLGLTTGYNFNFQPLGVGSAMAPLGAFSQISNLVSVMMSTLMVSYLVFITQKLIVEYIRLAMLYFFLPLGLLMRALSPTREFGGAMVGLSLALLIFYPLVIVFNDMLVRVPLTNEFKSFMDAAWAGLKNGALLFGPSLAYPFLAKIPVGGPVLAIMSVMGNVVSLFTAVSIFSRAAVYYFLIAVVLPIIDFIFLIGIAKDISKVLGEEVDVTNLTRMI
ncbi:Uncharacterised protein [Candidatus Anstonella stagnisolia]|nr:Uncharacterised protein [Candidatus Anstonella stagnisolia]